MEESEHLLAALEKMLAMKTVGVEPTATLEPEHPPFQRGSGSMWQMNQAQPRNVELNTLFKNPSGTLLRQFPFK